jgi:uncharacterized membrane protein YedE/YeeE
LAAFLVLVLIVGGIFFYTQRYLFSGFEDVKTLRSTIRQNAANFGWPVMSATRPVE